MNQHMPLEPVPFIDIGAQRRRLGKSIDDAVARVLTHCQFINGPEVTALEAALAEFSGAKHVVSCASGTDALLMVLMAKNVGPGDAVLCPSFTFCATGEAVALTGATPVFVDVDEATFNMDANALKRGIATAKKLGLKPKAVIPVDLFGQSADHDSIAAVAEADGQVVADRLRVEQDGGLPGGQGALGGLPVDVEKYQRLAGVVVVDRRLVQPDHVGDIVHPRAVIAAGRKQLGGDRQQLLTA